MKRRSVALFFATLSLLSGAACGQEQTDVVDNVGDAEQGRHGNILDNVDDAKQSVQDSVDKVQEGFDKNIYGD